MVAGGTPTEPVPPGVPVVEQAPWGEACGGPDDDVEEPSWPPCDPDMPEPLLPKLTFPHPLDECWLLLAHDPVLLVLLRLLRLEERGDFLAPCVLFQVPADCLESLVCVVFRLLVADDCSCDERRDSLSLLKVSAKKATPWEEGDDGKDCD